MTKYQKYTDQMSYSGEPNAKLYQHGVLRFNKIAGERWFTDCDRVELYVSDDAPEIAVKPVAYDGSDTYAYTRDGKSDGGNVAVRSVLSHFGIWHERMDESLPVPVRWDDDRGMVVVDVSVPVERWGHTARQA